MATVSDKTTNKLTSMFKVGYMFAAPDGKQRTGALILRGQTFADANATARKQLAKEYDWFKLTKTSIVEGDQPQADL